MSAGLCPVCHKSSLSYLAIKDGFFCYVCGSCGAVKEMTENRE